MANFLKMILLSLILFFSISQDVHSQNNPGSSAYKMSNPAYFDSLMTPVDSIEAPGNITPDVKDNVNYARLGIVSGTALTVLGAIYYRWKTAWWSNGTGKFHFYYEPHYAENVDKIGHIYGGILFAECFGAGLKWSGLDRESSLLYGGIFSSLIYAGVEIKDGFAPGWGFDVGDISGSLIGSYYPYLQEKIPLLKNFNFKWSYYPSNSVFYNELNKYSHNNQFFNDDYEGETFWLSADIKNLLPEKTVSFLPDFLNIALGVSVENLDNPITKRRVFIISPDIDISKLFKTDSEFLNTLFHLLNYIHIPLPAIQVSPQFKGYAIYLKP